MLFSVLFIFVFQQRSVFPREREVAYLTAPPPRTRLVGMLTHSSAFWCLSWNSRNSAGLYDTAITRSGVVVVQKDVELTYGSAPNTAVCVLLSFHNYRAFRTVQTKQAGGSSNCFLGAVGSDGRENRDVA